MISTRLLPTATLVWLALFWSHSSAQTAAVSQPPERLNGAIERFTDLFKPLHTDIAAISPDGKYLAYTVREKEMVSALIVDIENPSKLVSKVTVISDEQATPVLNTHSAEKTIGRIVWMRWVTPKRLVVQTNRAFPFSLDFRDEQQWFNATGEIIAFDADGRNAKSLVTPRDVPERLALEGSASKQKTVPRSPYVVDLDHTKEGCLILQADGYAQRTGMRNFERYSLNVITGQLVSIAHGTIRASVAPLFDKAGKPRITVPVSTEDPFPHQFVYDSGTLTGRWKTLNSLAGSDTATGFTIAPENYFGERAIPLGFGADPDTLYYASNVGKDTFGVYTMDMKTGKPTGFTVESPVYDMFVPEAGIYPLVSRSGVFEQSSTISSTSSITETQMLIDVPPPEDPLSTVAREKEAAEMMAKLDDNEGAAAALKSRPREVSSSPAFAGEKGNGPLVYDRYSSDVAGLRYEGKTRTVTWLQPALQSAQRELEAMMPGMTVEIVEWNRALTTFLVRSYGYTTPGRYSIFDQTKRRIMQFASAAPWLDENRVHRTELFSITSADGRVLTGALTFPRAARLIPAPVVVLCQPRPWDRLHVQFQPEAQALADMGFAVVQVNPRGAWGFGRKLRNSSRSQWATTDIDDAIAAVTGLSRQYALNPKRMAIAGSQYGGYLALRALQLRPETFRCAIAIGPVVDIDSWVAESHWKSRDVLPALERTFFGETQRQEGGSLLAVREAIKRPGLVLSYRGTPGQPETTAFANARRFVSATTSTEVPSELYELDTDFVNGLPRARAEAFQKVEDFLNLHVYGYKVNLGDLKVIKD